MQVGGHAWWWSQTVGSKTCSLLEHPGNKIIARAGLAFSREALSNNDGHDIECMVDNLPALRSSLYFLLRCQKEWPEPDNRYYRRLVSSVDFAEFHEFHEELECIDHYKGILNLYNSDNLNPFDLF